MSRVILTSLILILSLHHFVSADVGSPIPANIHRAKVVVAVIDTGLDPNLMNKKWVCAGGHKDFTGKGLVDNHGHGTHVSGLIDQYAKKFVFDSHNDPHKIDNIKIDYCQIVLKYYDPKAVGIDNLEATIQAFKWAIEQRVDIINYSGGGTSYSQEEHDVVIKALDRGIKVVVAAGNERSNIDLHKYYPAMYDKRIIVVGNLVKDKVRKPSAKWDSDVASSSNYGASVNTWELGTNVLSRLPGNGYGFMTGTSQATAIKSGKIVREMLSNK